MPERLTKCPLCKSGHFLNHIEITDYAVTKETFLLSKCTECDLLFTNPRPTSEEIAPYYDFPEYYSHQDKSKNIRKKANCLIMDAEQESYLTKQK